MTEETEKQETKAEPEKETATEQAKTERTFTQAEVNALEAKTRKTYETKYKQLEDEYKTFKTSIEEKQNKAEEAAKEKVEKLREGLPEGITALLDKLTFTEQLEWLSDPANTITKQTIKPLPEPNMERGRTQSIGTIV
jgi:molecular chaperone GrpE (heat shock protein)